MIYGYATHVIPLTASLMITEKDVLEFGGGLVSSSLIESIFLQSGVEERERSTLVLEDNKSWATHLQHRLSDDRFEVRYCEDYDEELNNVEKKEWGVVFVDSGAKDAEEKAYEQRYLDRNYFLEKQVFISCNSFTLKRLDSKNSESKKAQLRDKKAID